MLIEGEWITVYQPEQKFDEDGNQVMGKLKRFMDTTAFIKPADSLPTVDGKGEKAAYSCTVYVRSTQSVPIQRGDVIEFERDGIVKRVRVRSASSWRDYKRKQPIGAVFECSDYGYGNSGE